MISCTNEKRGGVPRRGGVTTKITFKKVGHRGYRSGHGCKEIGEKECILIEKTSEIDQKPSSLGKVGYWEELKRGEPVNIETDNSLGKVREFFQGVWPWYRRKKL